MTAASSAPCSIPSVFPFCARPATPTPAGRPRPAPPSKRTRASWPPSLIEPLVQGASGMLCAQAEDVRALGETCRAHGVLLICDEVATGFGRTGTLFASEQCGAATGPAVPGQGDHRRVPGHVGHGGLGRRVRCVPRRRPGTADVLPRPLLRRERLGGGGRPGTPPSDRGMGRHDACQRPQPSTCGASGRPHRPPPGCQGNTPTGSYGRRGAGAAGSGPALGPPRLRRRRRTRRPAASARRRGRAHAATDHDR